jgi:hypothetical protein
MAGEGSPFSPKSLFCALFLCAGLVSAGPARGGV